MTAPSPTRIAIIDDDPRGRNVTRQDVLDMGALPFVFDAAFATKTVPEAAEAIVENSDVAICDHRLRRGGYANFDGAELVAHLVGRGFPAILLTMFVDQDSDSTIRPWRRNVPVVLDRDAAGEAAFRRAIEHCQKEIAGQPRLGRQARRTFVRVHGLRTENEQTVVDAIIPAWNAQKAVSFPLDLIPGELHHAVNEGTLLTAMVNLGAPRASELFFSEFTLAPEPDEGDGLG